MADPSRLLSGLVLLLDVLAALLAGTLILFGLGQALGAAQPTPHLFSRRSVDHGLSTSAEKASLQRVNQSWEQTERSNAGISRRISAFA